MAQGFRAVYDPDIVATELETADAALDFRRRCRIAAGNLQQAIRLRRLLHPRYRGIAFAFASGKVLRALMPACLVVLFAGSLVATGAQPVFGGLLAAQCVAYGLALYRHLLPDLPAPRALDALRYLVAGHLAGLMGTVGYACGRNKGRWRRAAAPRS